MSRFKIYTSDATGSPPDPNTATTSVDIPFPSEQVSGNPPIMITPPNGYGTVFQTFTGVSFQDFGIPSNWAGGSIKIADGPILTAAKAALLQAMYETVDTDFYFTDGTETFTVRFSRNPTGFIYSQHYISEESMSYMRYSYSLELVIKEKLT